MTGGLLSFISFRFPKELLIPGRRLGAIVAPKIVPNHIVTVLVSILICAPRSIQLASTLPILRPFVRKSAEATHS